MGDGTGSAPPGPDRTATPVSPPRTGVAPYSGVLVPDARAGRRLARADGSGRSAKREEPWARSPAYAGMRGPAEGWPEQTAGGSGGLRPPVWGSGGYPPGQHSRHSSRVTAPALDSGSLPLPHLGDWMQEGQPAAHSQDAIAWAVARSQSRAARKPRSAKPAPPSCPS